MPSSLHWLHAAVVLVASRYFGDVVNRNSGTSCCKGYGSKCQLTIQLIGCLVSNALHQPAFFNQPSSTSLHQPAFINQPSSNSISPALAIWSLQPIILSKDECTLFFQSTFLLRINRAHILDYCHFYHDSKSEHAFLLSTVSFISFALSFNRLRTCSHLRWLSWQTTMNPRVVLFPLHMAIIFLSSWHRELFFLGN